MASRHYTESPLKRHLQAGRNEVFVCSKNRIFPKNPVFLKNVMPEKFVFQINGELVYALTSAALRPERGNKRDIPLENRAATENSAKNFIHPKKTEYNYFLLIKNIIY